MGTADLVAAIDEAVRELDPYGDQTYEVGIGIASAADAHLHDEVTARVATRVREAFGTWVETIHSYRGSDSRALGEAVAAHESIRSAVRDWTVAGRTDLDGWSERCRDQVNRVDTTWLDVRDQSLSVTSRPADASSSLTTAKDIPAP